MATHEHEAMTADPDGERKVRVAHTSSGLSSAALSAGISAFIFFIFGALTVQISVLEQFGITQSQQASWITITWLVAGAVSIPLCFYFKQPLMIGWTLPGLLYMGSLSDDFTLEQFAAANLVAGVLIIAIGAAGLGSRIVHLVPLPILMAMFAASILEYETRLVETTIDEVAIAGPMVVAYLAGRLLNNPRLPAVGVAVLAGAIAVLVLGEAGDLEVQSTLPTLEAPGLDFSLEAIASISLPMVVLVLGLGNVQSLGFMISEGFRPPLNFVTGVIGGMTVVNALFGGHPAAMARSGTAMLAGRDAGPIEGRYWAGLVAAVPTLTVAFGTGFFVAFVAVLPEAFVFTMAGLAILGPFQDAIQRAFGGSLRSGSLIAFVVTLSTFTLAGIPAAFWALFAGIGASLLLERGDLLTFWKQAFTPPSSQEESQPANVAPRG